MTRARVAELNEPTRSVIGSAAVLGARFRRDILARLAGVPASDLADALAAGAMPVCSSRPAPVRTGSGTNWSATPSTTRSPRPPGEERHAQTGRVLAELAGRGRDVDDAEAAELAVYCTGDWDQARQAEHAAAVTLLRP